MTKIENLTGFPLRLGNSAEILPAKRKAKVRGTMEGVGIVLIGDPQDTRIPLLEVREQQAIGLPPPADGTLYVVSGIVAAFAQRDDVMAPSRVDRKDGGRVTAAHALLRPRRDRPVRSRGEVAEQLDIAAMSLDEDGEKGKWPSMSYEDGVAAACRWMLYQDESAPMSDG